MAAEDLVNRSPLIHKAGGSKGKRRNKSSKKAPPPVPCGVAATSSVAAAAAAEETAPSAAAGNTTETLSSASAAGSSAGNGADAPIVDIDDDDDESIVVIDDDNGDEEEDGYDDTRLSSLKAEACPGELVSKEKFDADLAHEETIALREYYKHCRKPGELQRDLFQGGSRRNARALKRRSALTLMHRPEYKLTKKDLEQFVDKKVREKVAKIPSQYLTGDVINYFASLLNLRFSSKGERAHAYGTDFYIKLSKEGPERVSTWERKVHGGSILNLEMILLPVSDGEVHHKLAVVDVPCKSVYLYDSLGGDQDDVDAIAKNVTELFKFFTKKHRAKSAGTFRGVLKVSNKQRTGVDCGVFTIMNMVAVSLGLDPRSQGWSQRAIPHCRNRLMTLLMRDKNW